MVKFFKWLDNSYFIQFWLLALSAVLGFMFIFRPHLIPDSWLTIIGVWWLIDCIPIALRIYGKYLKSKEDMGG